MNTGEVIALIKAFGGSGGGSSGGGVLVVHDVDGTLDKTWQEIHDADFAVLKGLSDATWWITGAVEDEGDYLVGFYSYGLEARSYIASSPSGYPAFSE